MKKGLIAIAATAIIATGCASGGSPAMSSSTGVLPPIAAEARVEVHNNNWSDMVIYAVQNSHRMRLGMVTSMNTRSFDLPRYVGTSSGDLYLLARPIGSGEEFEMGPIHVSRGQWVELRLENHIRISNWAVW